MAASALDTTKKRNNQRRHHARSEDLAAFYALALSSDTDDCIIWPFATSNGYGAWSQPGQPHTVHRRVCIAKHGPPPFPRAVSAHSCGNGSRGCINWKHVRWATQKENMQDALRHGTVARGESSGVSKLLDHQVLSIRKRLSEGESVASVARAFHVCSGNIHAIRDGKTWRHLL